MKKLFVFSVLIILSALLFSCKEPLGLDDVKITMQANAYLPMTEGNYWVYSNDFNGAITRDSVVATGKIFIDGYNADEMTTFRDGKEYMKTYFVTDQNKIYMRAMILEPLLDTVFCGCGFKWKMQWRLIANFENSWNSTDTLTGDLYPSLVDDGKGGYKTVMTRTYHQIDLTGEKGVFEKMKLFDGNSYDAYSYKFSGRWLYKIDTNFVNVQFKKTQGSRYIDDYTIVYQDMSLVMNFSKNIGIVSTSGIIRNYKDSLYLHRRTLVNYHVK